MEKSNKKFVFTSMIILVVLAALFLVFYGINRPKGNPGSKEIEIDVIGSSGESAEYEIVTDAEFLSQAMDELAKNDSSFSYTGSGGDYGLMIETINGERAVFEKDGAYWALYVNDEYGQYGADSQPVVDGNHYTWKYEISE